MSDRTECCANFRDVGEFVNLLADTNLLPPGRILRGGKIDGIETAEAIGNPGTILNLRRGADRHTFGAGYYQVAASNDLEKYDTSNREVRRWLNEVVTVFENEGLRYPVFIHCTSGKDRTGVVVAALLLILGVPESIIVEEYLLSEGEVRAEWIHRALDGMRDLRRYFHRVD